MTAFRLTRAGFVGRVLSNIDEDQILEVEDQSVKGIRLPCYFRAHVLLFTVHLAERICLSDVIPSRCILSRRVSDS